MCVSKSKEKWKSNISDYSIHAGNLRALLDENALPVLLVIVHNRQPGILNRLTALRVDQPLSAETQSHLVGVEAHREVVDEIVAEEMLVPLEVQRCDEVLRVVWIGCAERLTAILRRVHKRDWRFLIVDVFILALQPPIVLPRTCRSVVAKRALNRVKKQAK